MTDDDRNSWIPSGREWNCTACHGTFRGKPEHVTTQPFQCFCSDECYESAQSADDEDEAETYDWLTVMDGPEVEGRERIWLGYETSSWKQLNEDGGTRVSAEPVQHIPLPWPMEREEIKNFLNQDDRGIDYLEQFTLEKAEGEPDVRGRWQYFESLRKSTVSVSG